MNSRNHSILTFVIALCSAPLAVVSGLRLIAPASIDWIDTLGPGLAGRMLPDAVFAAVGLAAGLAGVAVALLGQADARAATASTALRATAVGVAILLILLTPGELIPVAGYTFAAVVVCGGTLLAILLVRRHPWWGLALIGVIAAFLTWAVVHMRAAELASSFGASFVQELPGLLLAGLHLIAAAGLIARVATRGGNGRRVIARWVLRHRVAITVVAACCAAPYTLVRLTWLTPWPLLAPPGFDFATMPIVLLTGLSLGAAMLVGGLLTLGLILPWGRRFPKWIAGVGGRPVPIALAVVPASIVAALFTTGGLDLVLSMFEGALGDGSIAQTLELMLLFPFWLWGPLLALSTWGYAMARRAVTSAVPTADAGDVLAR